MDDNGTVNPGSLDTDIDASSEITVSIIEGFEGFEPYVYKFDTAISRTAGQAVWLMVDSTDSHTGGYYRNYTCQTVGATGRVWNGEVWEAPTTAFNMVYQLNFTTENSVAFQDCITQAGQFIAGVDTITFGVTTPSDHSGNPISALQFIQNLLDAGSSNFRRLIPKITRQRYIRVTEESVGGASTAELMLSRNGAVYHISGKEVWPNYRDPCGKWCVIDALIPSTLSASRAVDPSTLMIEQSTYQGSDGSIFLHPRGIPSAFEIFSIENK
jgi:hypothetical protein